MKKAFGSFVLILLVQYSFAQGILPDLTFSGDGKVETWVYPSSQHSKCIAFQADGKFLVAGGQYFSADWTALVRYNPDGSIDTGFHFLDNEVEIEAICIQPDGKIICTTKKGLIRLHSNGDIDSGFATSLTDELEGYTHMETAILPNGKVVSGGFKLNPSSGFYVAVFNPNGKPDLAFAQAGLFKHHPTATDFIFSLKCQQDGKIVVAGCSVPTGSARTTLYRLLPNGDLDSTFGVDGAIRELQLGISEGLDLHIQSDGKIVVAGYGQHQGEHTACLIRYTPDGTRDLTFGIDGVCFIPELTQHTGVMSLPNGKIMVHGINQEQYFGAIVQLSADGFLEPDFGENGVFFTSVVGGMDETMSIHHLESNKIAVLHSPVNHHNHNGMVLAKYILDFNVGLLNPGSDFKENMLVYPNPIADLLTVKFTLNAPESVGVDLYDLSGRLITRLSHGRQFDAGEHTESYQISPDVPAGNYTMVLSIQGNPVSSIQIMKK